MKKISRKNEKNENLKRKMKKNNGKINKNSEKKND